MLPHATSRIWEINLQTRESLGNIVKSLSNIRFPSPKIRFSSPKIRFSSYEIRFTKIGFPLSSTAFRFLQRLSDFLQRLSAFSKGFPNFPNSFPIFLNGFPLSVKSKKIYLWREVYERSLFELRIFCHLLPKLPSFVTPAKQYLCLTQHTPVVHLSSQQCAISKI